MRALLVFLLFCMYALVARWYYVCEFSGLCVEQVADTRLQTLQLKEGDQVILQGYDQFAFDTAVAVPLLNPNNNLFLDSVAAYLQRHSDKNLTITGYYLEVEKDIKPGFFENLGVARAAEIRKELVRRGIDEHRITLDYGLADSGPLLEPVDFEVYTPAQQRPSDFERVRFTFHNMTFSQANFKFDSDEFRPGEPFILYADSVKTYLNLNPDKRLIIIGHTDYMGTEAYNQDLGLRRAKSAKRYFQELGVTTDIEVQSMGETRPAATNKTAEGRAKNRRVNFLIVDRDPG